MDLVTLQNWVYPESTSDPLPYYPDDAVGRLPPPTITPTPVQPGVYKPDKLVEGYHSLVWKESFRLNGEFQLKTHEIEQTLAVLKKGTLVSHLETDDICIVTTHHIATDDTGKDVLTVTGRNLLTHILDNRISWAYGSGPSSDNRNAAVNVNLIFKIPDHLVFLLWSSIVFPHSEGGYQNTQKAFELPFNIIVPHTAITYSVSSSNKGDSYRTAWPPPMESRLDSVKALLDLDPRFGIKLLRPAKWSGRVFRPSLNSLRGEGSTSTVSNTDKIFVDVYDAIDRTLENYNRVVFRHDSGDIDSSEYLSSVKDFKNVVNAYTEIKPNAFGTAANQISNPPYLSTLVWPGDSRTTAAGSPLPKDLEARKYVAGIGYLMGEVSVTTEMKEKGFTDVEFSKIYAAGEVYLKEHEKVSMVTADISPYSQYVYKKQYDLGDVVLVYGKYGEPEKMQVSEYTRTEEVTGESGFPTLIRWTGETSGSTYD